MADKTQYQAKKLEGADDVDQVKTAEKRKSTEVASEGETQTKKFGGFSMGMNKKPGASKIKMNIGGGFNKSATSPVKPSPGLQSAESKPKKSPAIASVFSNEDSESEEEEMPPEAKMRMKNIGRNTPTAAGPNSFGKGRLGFCDRQKIIQREIQDEIEKVEKTQHD